jgi:hypothetical protein
MKWTLLFLAAAISLCPAEETWRSRVKPDRPGDFPPVRPFRAEFRFGWSNVVEAARARASISYEGNKAITTVTGGTRGIARSLWSLTARHRAETSLRDFSPLFVSQSETYAKKKVFTEMVAKPDGLWYIRRVPTDPGNRPRWKRLKVAPARDIVSGMLFLRSLPLRDGDRIGLISFPGDSPFLCEVLVEKRETIKSGGRPVKAIRLSFKLQRIDTGRDNQLVAHGKFRSGTVWVSDDENRVPLRAEVQIFIGYVYGELVSITYDS